MKFIKKVIGNKPKKKRLALHTLCATAVMLVSYCAWLIISLQGKFFLERVNTPPDPETGIVDYRHIVKTLRGFRTKEYDFSRYYGDDSLHHYNNDRAFSPNHEFNLEILYEDPQTEQAILAIRGRTIRDFPVLTLVSYSQGEFHSIPYYVGNDRQIYFAAKKVLLENLDDDSDLEVILGILLVSDVNGAQMWHKTRYDYNTEKQAYIQSSTTHTHGLNWE